MKKLRFLSNTAHNDNSVGSFNGFSQHALVMDEITVENNRAINGSALMLISDSKAVLSNWVFTDNQANHTTHGLIFNSSSADHTLRISDSVLQSTSYI